MGKGGIGFALILVVLAALYVGPLLLKASDELRSYRPDSPRLSAPRHDEIPPTHKAGDTL